MKLTKPYKKIKRFTKIEMLMINLLAGTFDECPGEYLKCTGVYQECTGNYRNC